MHHPNHPRIALFCLAGFVLAFFLSMRVFTSDRGWRHIVTSDGRGYYAYLPALLIDQDPTFAKVVEREKKLLGYPHYKPGYLVKSDERNLNKYFSGEAFLLLPFFLLGMLFTFFAGTPMDGYSFFFQLFIGLGALFYLVLGLNFLRKILDFMQIRAKAATLVLVVIFLGTNLFYYSLWQPTMSHIFSFFTINGFLWYTIRAIQQWQLKTAAWMGLYIGLTCLVRPTNVLVILLIPFLAGDRQNLMRFFTNIRKKKGVTLLLLLIAFLVFSTQLILWQIQTGRFFVWSYQSEGFRFNSPEIMNVLFSFRKGLFIYTPLILVSWAGMIVLLWRSRLQFFSVLGFIVASTFVTASWWNWYYGDGFGLRAFIDYYGIFAILLAILVDRIQSRTGFIVMVVLTIPFVLLNFVQTWQYTNKIMQPNSMNREKYAYIFMRADSSVINSLGGNQEIAGYDINPVHPLKTFSNDFEQDQEHWSKISTVQSANAFSGTHAGYLDSVHPYSPGIVIRAGQLGIAHSSCYIEGEIMVWDSVIGASNGALVVLSMDSINEGENWWQGFKLNDVPQKKIKSWRKCTFSLMLPDISNPDGILKVYIWNTQKKPMLIDDFRVRFYGSDK